MNNRLYLYVKAFSDMGTMMDTLVLTTVMYTLTHSGTYIAMSLFARTAGGVLSSLLSGVMADRMERRRLMIFSDLLRCASVVLLVVAPTSSMILLVSFLIGLFGSFFTVSFSAEIPQMFGEGNVLAVNALISRLSAVSMVVGFFGAGWLQHWLGYRFVLGVDAASYVVSAAVLSVMRWQRTIHRVESTKQGAFHILWHDTVQVKRYLWAQPLLLIVFFGYLIETFGASSHNVGIPLLAALVSPSHQDLWYGIIWGVWAIGNVVSTSLMPRIGWIHRNLYHTYWVTTVCCSLGFISLLSSEGVARILVFAVITGIFDAASGTLCSTIMQQAHPAVRGRVFGVSSLLNRLGFGVGFLTVPLLLARVSMPHMVWILHGTVITATVFSMVLALRRYRQHLQPESAVVGA